MKIYLTNQCTSLDIFNYFMFIANIGFPIYVYNASLEYENFQPTEIIFLVGNYYLFVIPICVIFLLYFLIIDRKTKLNSKNSKTQIIITAISLTFLY